MGIMKVYRRGYTIDDAGNIPGWLNENDPRPAREQLDEGYKICGGWVPMEGFGLREDDALTYGRDPPMKPYAEFVFRKERVLIYPSDWIAIVQPDRSFEVCRMD